LTRAPYIEREVLRAFRRASEQPVVLYAAEGLGNGWGLIDFRYRKLYVRLDAEKGCAIAFLALSGEFSPSWYAHDALEIARGGDPAYMSTARLCDQLLQHYDEVLATISTEGGQQRIAAIQSPSFKLWAEESAGWRSPVRQAELATMIADAKRRDAEEMRRWARRAPIWLLKAAIIAGDLALSIYVGFHHT